MSDKSKESKSLFIEWLEKLQQESWQLELLISGFALFGIYSARILIVDFEFYIENNLSSDTFRLIAKMLHTIFEMGWFIFFFNLLIHVILRGLWIGAIGLRYVSQEIDYDQLNYSEIFTNYLRKKVGSYDDFIERLEKMCSVIFAFTFLLFSLFMSLIIFFLPIVLLRIILESFVESGVQLALVTGMIAIIYIGIGFMVFIDLITLGGFKRIKEKNISKIYFYIYRFYSFITLSFLYRPLLYNFIDNKYTKKLFYLSIPYIFIIFIGKSMFENSFNPFLPERINLLDAGQLMDNYYYDDLRNKSLDEFENEKRFLNKNSLLKISLEHFNIKENFSSFFIKVDRQLIDLIEKDTKIKPFKERGVSFSWFNNNKIDDKALEKIENSKSDEMVKLYLLRKDIRLKYKDDKKTLEKEINALELKIKAAEKKWQSKLKQFKIEKTIKIKEAFVSNYQISIDSLIVPLDNCFYFRHPHLNEEGFKCIYATDSLTKGIHQMKVKYKFLETNGDNTSKVNYDSLYLPILKH
jgi:hypothetical protein